MALDLACEVEKWCKSSWASAGANFRQEPAQNQRCPTSGPYLAPLDGGYRLLLVTGFAQRDKGAAEAAGHPMDAAAKVAAIAAECEKKRKLHLERVRAAKSTAVVDVRAPAVGLGSGSSPSEEMPGGAWEASDLRHLRRH